MALITTFEGVQNPITVNDLFNVNDFMGVRMFGPDAWPQVKKAAAIIAQRAANAPILFFLRSQGTNTQAAGQSSELGRKLWGYNDRAGVELLGAAAWGAVKNEFDELLGWNPFSTVKKAFNYVTYPVRYVVRKAAGSGIPGISEAGKGVQYLWKAGEEFSPVTTGEKLYNAATGEGYYTEAEIKAEQQKKEQKQLQQMYKDQTARASKAASEAAKAQAAYEKAQEAAAVAQKEFTDKLNVLQETAQATGLTTAAAAAQAATDNTRTILLVVGVGGIVYLIARKKR